MFGLPIRVPAVKESTALGAAMDAGIGAGLYPDVATAARRAVSFERTVDPDPAAYRLYEELYGNWLRVYSGELGLVEKGLLKPL